MPSDEDEDENEETNNATNEKDSDHDDAIFAPVQVQVPWPTNTNTNTHTNTNCPMLMSSPIHSRVSQEDKQTQAQALGNSIDDSHYHNQRNTATRCVTPPLEPSLNRWETYSKRGTDQQEESSIHQQQQQQQPKTVSHFHALSVSDAPLSWRMDPSHSLADWRLEIFNRSTKQFDTYHVHKVVLCVGPRACAYFTNAVHRDTHHIPLIAKACDLIPQFLDYVYQLPRFRLETNTVVGISFIAHFLQQPKLLQDTMEFVYQDLSSSNLHHYLCEATYYDQHELVDWILQLGSQEILSMERHELTAFLEELSLPQFIKVLDRVEPSRTETPLLSALLVDFCIYHRHELSIEFLEECSPYIFLLTPETAVALLELTLTLGDGQRTTLQDKCLQHLSQNWHDLDDYTIFEQLVETQPDLALEWLPQLLRDASSHFRQVQDELRDAWVQQSTIQDDLQSTKAQLDLVQEENAQLKKTLDSTKMELRAQLHGLMKKRTSDRMEQQACKSHWNQERRLWEQERQRWLEERNALEQELFRLKATLGLRRKRGTTKSKENVCPQVETQSIFSYFSNVGMGDIDDSLDTSFDLSSM